MSAGANASEHRGDAYAEACTTVRRLLAEAVREDARARHRLGVFLCRVRGAPELYGRGAIDRIARDLEVGADTLYRCAAVADNWSADALEALLTRTGRHGDPLSWSHLVTLTKIASSTQRALAIEKCLDDDLSVRDLVRYIAMLRGASADDGTEGDAPSTHTTLTQGVRKLSRAVLHMDVFIEAIDAQLSSDDLADDELLARVIGACESLHEKLDITVGRLRNAQMSSGRRLRAASPIAAAGGESADDTAEEEGAASSSPPAMRRSTEPR
jgi:hypothetical protein